MKGTLISTAKDRFQFANEIFPVLTVPGCEMLKISTDSTRGFYGFGAAITPSSCYELSLMDPVKRKELLTHLYGKDGVGLSVGRLCVGSCDYSPELYSYDDVPFDTELKHFSIDRDKNYIIPMIKEILEINPELYLFASPWSPPFWMKTGGSMCGGYMRGDFLDCYGDYIVKYIKAYADEGIKISAVTPQNEPNNQQWGLMPACVWHPEMEAEFIGILRKKFNKHSLDVKIWMLDHAFDDTGRVMWSLANCSGLLENCDGAAFHYYSGTVEQTVQVLRTYPKLQLHFTEGGPRLTENYDTDWCKWGIIASRLLKAGYSSFTGWNLMLDETGGPHIGPFMGICGGLITNDHLTGELRCSGQYKALAHIAPYITPESVIRPVSVSDSYGPTVGSYPNFDREIEGFAIDSQNGRTVAVLINPNGRFKSAQIELCGKLWYLNLHPESIATVIIEE